MSSQQEKKFCLGTEYRPHTKTAMNDHGICWGCPECEKLIMKGREDGETKGYYKPYSSAIRGNSKRR